MMKPFNGNSRTKIWKIIDGIYEKLIWIHMEMKPNVVCGAYSFSFVPVHCPVHVHLSFWSVRLDPLWENLVRISIGWILLFIFSFRWNRTFKVKSNGKMKTIVEIFSYDNIVFTTYIAWSSILVMKMMCMSVATAIQRIKTRVSWIFLLCKRASNVCFSGMKRDRINMNLKFFSRQLQFTRLRVFQTLNITFSLIERNEWFPRK